MKEVSLYGKQQTLREAFSLVKKDIIKTWIFLGCLIILNLFLLLYIMYVKRLIPLGA